jgi:hypothetical protein
MQLSLLEKRVDELVGDLAGYHGHRTIWLDPRGDLVHAEPDDMLEELGFDYVATLMRPDRDQLTGVLLRRIPIEPERTISQPAWHGPAASLAPA